MSMCIVDVDDAVVINIPYIILLVHPLKRENVFCSFVKIHY